jgi:hypothetical protein
MKSAMLRYEQSSIGRGTKYTVTKGVEPLSFSEALDLMARDSDFREGLTATLAASNHAAYRWETPPVTHHLLRRPFEFVLMDSPGLAPSPEPDAFRSHFSRVASEVDVLAIPNLGNTATLVIPRQLAEPLNYAHLARFVRGAPPAQVHHLWQCVAKTVKANVSSHPLWLSTAGGGVSWLHVRVEGVPKYYSYRPYANDA